jgi:hypothetical protein
MPGTVDMGWLLAQGERLEQHGLAAFMVSTLFWYEREADSMLTISSTTFTLGIVT